MRKNILLAALAAVLSVLGSTAFAQKASELKYYNVRDLGLKLVNQGFQDCVRDGSAVKDAQVKGATEYDANMQKPAEATEKKVSEGPVNDGYFTRLPARIEGKVRKAVWDLGQNSAGIAIRFRSNAKVIGARWTLLNNFRMSHMTPTGICGFDLYALNDGEWRFVGTAQPNGKESINVFRRNMNGQMRDYVMFFPLYDGVIDLSIGVEEGAVVEQPTVIGNNPFGGKSTKPVVVYGTSVTQGGCATRPGMVFTNILSRKLKREFVNLGFSGNGRMDRIMAEEMARIDAGAYLIDCLGNCTQQTVKDSTEAFIKTIADAHPDVPVFMISNYPYAYEWIDAGTFEDVSGEDALWYDAYRKLRAEGYKNLRYIEIGGKHNPLDPMQGSAIGPDHEGTVDGCHLTDLGFLRMADFLYPYLKRVK
ncbi:MAG: SGNH/GDSL hydrolase family protein [Bacteroidales bacterium]|nr:SGNH/GDSL hydrolase family protein [Bacteroidales bacterium]